jgi:hypothetical protein
MQHSLFFPLNRINYSTRHAFAFIFALLNKAMAVEECDARGDARSDMARQQKII